MVIEAIRDHLYSILSGYGDFWCSNLYDGSCTIEFTHPTYNKKLKLSRAIYRISLSDGLAVVTIFDDIVGQFQYSDPSFPDNLLQSLPVLHLPDGDGLPQVGAATQI